MSSIFKFQSLIFNLNHHQCSLIPTLYFGFLCSGGVTDARIGFHSLTDQKGITSVIKDIITHPDYKPPAMYADIALIQLMTPVSFSTSVRPACLYQPFDTVPTQAWVSGWGVTEYSK